MKEILEEFTKDLSDSFKKEIIEIVEKKNPKNKSQLRAILMEFRKDKKFIKIGKFTMDYWLQRGWSTEDSIVMKNKNKVNNIPNGSPMQRSYWENRINPKTGKNYTEYEAIFKIKSHRKFNKEYWIERGFSNTDSERLANKEQLSNCEKASRKSKDNPEYYKNRTWNQIGYWIKKGFSEEEAKKKVSSLQDKNSLKTLVKKLGDLEGIERYREISKNLSHSHSIDRYLNKYGEKGLEIYKDHIHKKTNNFSYVSKESLIFFIPIYKEIRKIVKREDVKWGIKGSKEYFIWDDFSKRIFFYDFCLPGHKIIIEFHGIYWHPNPKWEKERWNKWKCMGNNADDKRKYDEYKKQLAISKGFNVIEVFSDEKENFDVKIILDLITKQ